MIQGKLRAILDGDRYPALKPCIQWVKREERPALDSRFDTKLGQLTLWHDGGDTHLA